MKFSEEWKKYAVLLTVLATFCTLANLAFQLYKDNRDLGITNGKLSKAVSEHEETIKKMSFKVDKSDVSFRLNNILTDPISIRATSGIDKILNGNAYLKRFDSLKNWKHEAISPLLFFATKRFKNVKIDIDKSDFLNSLNGDFWYIEEPNYSVNKVMSGLREDERITLKYYPYVYIFCFQKSRIQDIANSFIRYQDQLSSNFYEKIVLNLAKASQLSPTNEVFDNINNLISEATSHNKSLISSVEASFITNKLFYIFGTELLFGHNEAISFGGIYNPIAFENNNDIIFFKSLTTYNDTAKSLKLFVIDQLAIVLTPTNCYIIKASSPAVNELDDGYLRTQNEFFTNLQIINQ